MRFSQPAGSFSSSAIFPRLRLPHPARPHWRGERRGEPTFFFFFFSPAPIGPKEGSAQSLRAAIGEKKNKTRPSSFHWLRAGGRIEGGSAPSHVTREPDGGRGRTKVAGPRTASHGLLPVPAARRPPPPPPP